MKRTYAKHDAQSGFSMIEVLVTLTILLVGLLGLAGTMMHGHRSEAESYQRAQALVLMQDMVARINANRQVASCYAFTTDAAGGGPYLGTSATARPSCVAGTALQNALAIQDMEEWNDLLLGAAEMTNARANIGAMNGARGCVSFNALTGIYQVSVAWQGLGATATPPAAWTCGQGNYGDEKWRRVVSVTLKLANIN